MTNEKEDPTGSSELDNTGDDYPEVEDPTEPASEDAEQNAPEDSEVTDDTESESPPDVDDDFSTDVLENEGGSLHPSEKTSESEETLLESEAETRDSTEDADSEKLDEEAAAPVASDSAETADSQANDSESKDSSDDTETAESLQNKKLLNGALAGWTIAIVALLGIGGFAIYNGTQTTVPLAPASYSESDDATAETCEAFEDADLKCEVFTKPSYDAPNGSIITQSASAGEKIRKGSTVSVTYSSGPEFGEMPDVIGIPLEYASTELNAEAIEIERTEEVDNSGLPSGHIVNSSVEKGSVTTNGDSVVLTISSGKVTAPDFTDMSTDQAAKEAADLGIELNIDWVEGSEPYGAVQSQSVDEGDPITDGAVTVEVNRPAGDAAIAIPEVTGMGQDEAVSTLNEAGITMLNIVEVPGDEDEVLNVSPSESNYVSASQVVTVVVTVTD